MSGVWDSNDQGINKQTWEGGFLLCQEETKQDHKVKGREQGEERGAVAGKVLSNQWVNPDKARGRARKKVKAAKAVSVEEEKNKNKNLFKRGE
jgi:hypothetical protein